MYSFNHSLTSALEVGERPDTLPGRFTHRERDPGTHWVGGCVGPREKFLAPAGNRNLEARSSSP